MASRIAVMEGGLIQQLGTPEEIYDRPANTFVATFMGSPAMNLLDATVADGGTALRVGDQVFPMPPGAAAPVDGTPVKLGLRPEWINLSGEGAPLTLKVELTEPTGPDIYVSLSVQSQRLMARLPAGVEIRPGTERAFHVVYDKAPIFDAESGAALYA